MTEARAVSHRCGIKTAWVDGAATAEGAVASVAAALSGEPVGQLLVFFSSAYAADEINVAFSRRFAGTPIAACSSAGELSPAGNLDRGVVAVAFPKSGFRIVSASLPNVDELDVERTADIVRSLRRRLDAAPDAKAGASRFALSLIDGLANAEERVVSVIDQALDGIPLVGGSAGDDLAFRRTALIHDGEVKLTAAILMIVETDYPVEIFKTDNFEPTDVKFVVTASDDGARTVRELNAEPAATEYAMAVGLDPENLSPMSFASHPLVVRVGGEYFCRSIRRLNPDGSLSFFCAIDRGLVLTLARPLDVVEVTRAELERLEARLGGVDLVIGFDCVLRRLDAEIRQKRRPISDLYRQYNVVGFETYGEQYRSMHLNQTFTGVAIGYAGAA
ncbi:FIST N-terminal domain-containing protein [Chenggangzhangella methanolivorans]|uniref:FIST C-terminal domain-containing protein n=1 Tax=Chenggangzhangella methanolivorans TaxID=1437009 RepID=A0A9E6UNF5_9HYPH|nr:FIST N-terminal domain-containing protein [Chenggangzhangella methanolivorans]QZO01036.1 FIST C-terminal domain-containing protein [Chenggangzhangella methanolivorans]